MQCALFHPLGLEFTAIIPHVGVGGRQSISLDIRMRRGVLHVITNRMI